jgi:hypothetical protein
MTFAVERHHIAAFDEQIKLRRIDAWRKIAAMLSQPSAVTTE